MRGRGRGRGRRRRRRSGWFFRGGGGGGGEIGGGGGGGQPVVEFARLLGLVHGHRQNAAGNLDIRAFRALHDHDASCEEGRRWGGGWRMIYDEKRDA